MDVYHVIVKRKDGSLTQSIKEKESSAIKSVKAYINFKNEPAAIVIHDKKVIFSMPESAASDKAFSQAAMKKAYASGPDKPAINPPTSPADVVVVPSDRIKSLAAQYEKEVKTGKVVVPQTQRKADPCTVRILENACLASSLGQGVPLVAAKLICGESKEDIEKLAIEIASGTKNLDAALEELVGAKMEKTPEIPVSNIPNIAKIMRGRKDTTFPKTRFREDIGNEEDPNDIKNRSIPDGIIIYTTVASDDGVHEMVAFAMGYTPSSLINSHYPAGLTGYDYRRPLPLVRPSYKIPVWSALGGRIGSPKTLIARIQEKYSDDQVKIVIANGVDLA